MSQTKGLMLVWIFLCLLKHHDEVKALPHLSHTKGFRSVWLLLCVSRWPGSCPHSVNSQERGSEHHTAGRLTVNSEERVTTLDWAGRMTVSTMQDDWAPCRLTVSTMQQAGWQWAPCSRQADSEHHAAGRLTVSTMQADSDSTMQQAGWQWAPCSRQADSKHHTVGKQTAELMTKQRNYSDLQIKSDIYYSTLLFYFSTLSTLMSLT